MNTTIYFGKNIITMDENFPRPEAVGVKDGIIAAVGTLADCRTALPGAEEIALETRTLLPAFIDPHSHVTMVAEALSMADLRDAVGFEEVSRRLREFKEKNLPNDDISPVIGFGYDNNNMPDSKHPDGTVLAAAGIPNPTAVIHVSAHMGAVCEELLAAFGITKDTPDPTDGKIGRHPDGTPNGYLEEAPFMNAIGAPKKSVGAKTESLARAVGVYARGGITTLQDGMVGPEQAAALSAAAQSGALDCDVVMMYMISAADALYENFPELSKDYNRRLRIGGYKIFLDGSPQAHTAWLSEPYANRENYSGYPIYEDAAVVAFCKKALADNMQILAHCNGDAASEQFIRAYAIAKSELPDAPDIRPVMVHSQTVRYDQLERMAALGIIPSFFTAHTYFWGDVHRVNLGEERASRISPCAHALSLGMTPNFHQDAPVIPPDMLKTISCAVNRTTRSGFVLGEHERIPVYEALKCVTINAAYQYFEEDAKGSITSGKKADLVILDQNPLDVPPAEIEHIKVLETIKEGVTIFKAD